MMQSEKEKDGKNIVYTVNAPKMLLRSPAASAGSGVICQVKKRSDDLKERILDLYNNADTYIDFLNALHEQKLYRYFCSHRDELEAIFAGEVM